MPTRSRDPLDRIRDNVPNPSIVNRMRKAGCRVTLDRVDGHRLIVDVDRLEVPPQMARCDYLFVSERLTVVPIELKRGKVEAADARRQLQAGADLASRDLIPPDVETTLKPVVFSRAIDKAQRALLRQSGYRVRYRGGRYEIDVASCGSSLADALR